MSPEPKSYGDVVLALDNLCVREHLHPKSETRRRAFANLGYLIGSKVPPAEAWTRLQSFIEGEIAPPPQ